MVSGLAVIVVVGATVAALAAATTPGGIAPRKVVTCDEAIAFTRGPRPGTRVLFGRAALALNWGENGGPAQSSSIRVLACGPVLGRRWLAFPGGYFLRKPACVPLIVRVGAKSAHIRLGIGRSCR